VHICLKYENLLTSSLLLTSASKLLADEVPIFETDCIIKIPELPCSRNHIATVQTNIKVTHTQETCTRNLYQKLSEMHETKNCAVWLVGCVWKSVWYHYQKLAPNRAAF